jgi:hypothetical protein
MFHLSVLFVRACQASEHEGPGYDRCLSALTISSLSLNTNLLSISQPRKDEPASPRPCRLSAALTRPLAWYPQQTVAEHESALKLKLMSPVELVCLPCDDCDAPLSAICTISAGGAPLHDEAYQVQHGL